MPTANVKVASLATHELFSSNADLAIVENTDIVRRWAIYLRQGHTHSQLLVDVLSHNASRTSAWLEALKWLPVSERQTLDIRGVHDDTAFSTPHCTNEMPWLMILRKA